MCLVSMVRVEPDAHNAALEGLDSFRQSLWPLLERIENEPYTDWSISDLAEETHLSTPHFSRCFRRLLDKTPKQYLIETRMRAAAAELIADPPKAIKQISRRAGYADIHTFTHAFGHFFGISPGAYRRHAARL